MSDFESEATFWTKPLLTCGLLTLRATDADLLVNKFYGQATKGMR
jgi:hypothetical protein